VDFVETVPEGMNIEPPHGLNPVATHESWKEMIDSAKESIKIASMYWYLTAENGFAHHSSAQPGKQVMEAIRRAVGRGVKLDVVLSTHTRSMNNDQEVESLEKLGRVSRVNMTRLLGAGILHSKVMIIDDESFYVGSANFDWRALAHVKETGLTFKHCPRLGADVVKIFKTYKLVSGEGELPRSANDEGLEALTNEESPTRVNIGGQQSDVYVTSSPPYLNKGTGRTNDIDAVLQFITEAQQNIDISVMNYSPRQDYARPKVYWPVIDDALRAAATTRKVRVRLLFGLWRGTRASEIAWYKSLNSLQSPDFGPGGIEVRLYLVPALDEFQKSIPFARVKHDKYMVTEKSLFVSNNNWTPDYFINTAGVSLAITPRPSQDEAEQSPSIVRDFANIFERDWRSDYSMSVEEGEKYWLENFDRSGKKV